MFDLFLSQIPTFFTTPIMLFFLRAAATTIVMCVVGFFCGYVFGAIVVAIRITHSKWLLPLRFAVILYVEIFRRIPFLVILLMVVFGGESLGIHMRTISIAMVAICLITVAFISEIIRAGVEGVNVTQWEAAETMNFSRLRTLFVVILPQAWRAILPPSVAYLVGFVKDTSLASQIGVVEITFAGKVFYNKGFSSLLVFGTVLVLYFAISWPLARAGRALEERLTRRHRLEKTHP